MSVARSSASMVLEQQAKAVKECREQIEIVKLQVQAVKDKLREAEGNLTKRVRDLHLAENDLIRAETAHELSVKFGEEYREKEAKREKQERGRSRGNKMREAAASEPPAMPTRAVTPPPAGKPSAEVWMNNPRPPQYHKTYRVLNWKCEYDDGATHLQYICTLFNVS